jgi:hypothetical protein
VRRGLLFLLALLVTACRTSGPVQCGACAGAGYVLSGGPEQVARARVTECVTSRPCVTRRVALGQRQYQQQLPMLTSSPWDHLDGATLTVTVRTQHGVWQGHGPLQFRPGGDGPCDCAALSAEVPLRPVNRPG